MGKDFVCKFFTNREHYDLSRTREKDMIYVDRQLRYKTPEDREKYEKYYWDDTNRFYEHYMNCDLLDPTGDEGKIMTFSEVKQEIIESMKEKNYEKQLILTMILVEMSEKSFDGEEEKSIFWYSYC